MFRKSAASQSDRKSVPVSERVTTVLGAGVSLSGKLSGTGGVRIEGAFEGEVVLRGMLVIAESGRVICPHVQAETVIVAGALKGDITAQKVVIRGTGRVWGNVSAVSFSTDEGAFLRGQIRMEEQADFEETPADADESGT